MIKFTLETASGSTLAFKDEAETTITDSGPMAAESVPEGAMICLRPGPDGLAKVLIKETV